MAAKQETIDQISDAEVFNEALADESKAPEPAPEPSPEPEPQTEERPRDEAGRFVAKDKEAESKPVEQPEPREEKSEGNIPSWRLKEEADARREALAQLETERRQRETFQRQLWELQQKLQAKEQLPEEPIDIFADPDAWKQAERRKFEGEMRQMRGEMSLQLAGIKYGDQTLKDAFQALQTEVMSGNTTPHRLVMESNNPGETLVSWFKREQTMKLVGDNPETFVEKVLNEALEDRDFLAKALEKARGVATTQPTQVKLPPSLNKATASQSNAGPSDTDTSDTAIFNYAMR